MNVRYFYITDRLKAGDMDIIIYKPTEDMKKDSHQGTSRQDISHSLENSHEVRWNQQTHVL